MKPKRWWIAAAAAGCLLAAMLVAGSLVERFVYDQPLIRKTGEPTAAKGDRPRSIRWLEAGIKAVEPRGLYILIDTAANRLILKRGDKIVKEFVVSCGSGGFLEEPGGGRTWIFDTPRGEYAVQNKLVNPTWIKPDWAFYEEGEPLPTDFNERIDNDTLGDYALGFGNGYFIHGTLYTRLLGRNVTHGCVRVGDADLKQIYQTVPFGAKVYIY
jgi:lipoprotein-anchoring transpeptidase ErfK/SrfK